jgi:glycosyltransferase involved in cell wall biosynthesis
MLVWSYWPGPIGGAENQCRKLSRSLSKFSNIRCVVLTAKLQRTSPSCERDDSVDIVRVFVPQLWVDRIIAWRDRLWRQRKPLETARTSPGSSPGRLSDTAIFLSAVVRWINTLVFMLGASAWLLWHRREIDILHVHIGDWIAGYGGWIGARLGIPVVCKASNMPALPQLETSIPLRKVWDRWRRKIYYVALHTAIRDELVADGVKQERIRVIPNGVEPPVDIAEPGTGGYVLYVGNFTQGQSHKGFDVLCKAWAQVCLVNPKAKLVMAGQGDTTPWSQMFEQLGVIQQVEFVGYVQPLDELYRGAALFVLPSRHEGMSNALLEAQAWGLPAVVSAIPGNSLVVDDGISGVVVPVGDHLAFVEAILFLLADAQKRKAMGTSARARINEHFTIDRVAGNYTALYADLLQ